jgi:hypothetical protein
MGSGTGFPFNAITNTIRFALTVADPLQWVLSVDCFFFSVEVHNTAFADTCKDALFYKGQTPQRRHESEDMRAKTTCDTFGWKLCVANPQLDPLSPGSRPEPTLPYRSMGYVKSLGPKYAPCHVFLSELMNGVNDPNKRNRTWARHVANT